MTVGQFEAAVGPADNRPPKRRGRAVAALVAVLAVVVLAVSGWAGWSFLMPVYQGRDDPYDELPRSAALLSSANREAAGLDHILFKQNDLHLSTSSWARWTSNDMGDVQLDVKYELHEATSSASGREAAAAWLDDRIAHGEKSFAGAAEVRGVGDEAVEKRVPSGYEVFVRAGNATITVSYSVHGTDGTKEAEQVQKTARRMAALAVEHFDKANAGAS
ncbi:hypothetical protein [Streptomyces sp. SS8]